MSDRAELEGFSRVRCRELDRRAIEDYGVPSLLLMEHASIGAALLAMRVLARPIAEARVWVLCGPGNNGGDGYAIARHLANAGSALSVWDLCDPQAQRAGSDPAINRGMILRMGIAAIAAFEKLPPVPSPPPDLVVDAIFGTGLDRAPSGRFADAIAAINSLGAPILAVDIPSGLDADRGEPLGVAVNARWTVTFGLPKRGFYAKGARAFTGEVYVVPIGAPRALLPATLAAFPPEPTQLGSA